MLVHVCVSVYERERLRYEGGCMYVCMWMCGTGRQGNGVGVKADRSQDENSDYTCARYIYIALSLLIIFECVSYYLFYSAFL